ncbi:MAG: hypothetical protein WA754_22730, partial [Pseudolabrys sp.]
TQSFRRNAREVWAAESDRIVSIPRSPREFESSGLPWNVIKKLSMTDVGTHYEVDVTFQHHHAAN